MDPPFIEDAIIAGIDLPSALSLFAQRWNKREQEEQGGFTLVARIVKRIASHHAQSSSPDCAVIGFSH